MVHSRARTLKSIVHVEAAARVVVLRVDEPKVVVPHGQPEHASARSSAKARQSSGAALTHTTTAPAEQIHNNNCGVAPTKRTKSLQVCILESTYSIAYASIPELTFAASGMSMSRWPSSTSSVSTGPARKVCRGRQQRK